MELSPVTAENVGPDYQDDLLLKAQAKTWTAIRTVTGQLRVGATEFDAHELLRATLKEMGAEKSWHPPQIRFGANTVKSFGKPGSKEIALAENDIYFLDIGPVFHGYEGDAGETFTLGDDEDLIRLAGDAKRVFNTVKAHWLETGLTGRGLYVFAEGAAAERGWKLSLDGASGHRVSDFPHAIHHRGKLRTFTERPSPNRWILEIHLFHPGREVGAFYEDIL